MLFSNSSVKTNRYVHTFFTPQKYQFRFINAILSRPDIYPDFPFEVSLTGALLADGLCFAV